MNIKNMLDLKSQMARIIHESSSLDFPQELILNKGIEYPKYKITIELVDEKVFIDNKGVKWVRVDDDSE